MNRSQTLIVSLASLALAVPSALADDLTPPAWRGVPGSTFQHWGFNNPTGGPPDSGLSNPNGTPQVIVSPGATWVAVEPTGQRNGAFALGFSDSLVFEVPNDGHGHGPKELWLQYTYSTLNGIGPQSAVFDPAMGGPFTLISSTLTHLGNGLYHTLDIYSYPGCPASEFVTLTQGTAGAMVWVDQVVIDTICVPGPQSIGLAGAAGVFGIRRRRR